jgi:MT0933-like antitoxin protein
MHMGFLDDAKKLGKKAKGLVAKHDDQMKGGVDKAAHLADEKTKGKHTDQIEGAAKKTKDAIDKLAD